MITNKTNITTINYIFNFINQFDHTLIKGKIHIHLDELTLRIMTLP